MPQLERKTGVSLPDESDKTGVSMPQLERKTGVSLPGGGDIMPKLKLWDSNDKQHGIFDTVEDAYKDIQKYAAENKIKIYYYRQNFLEDGTINIDYGSHTHFFYIKEVIE